MQLKYSTAPADRGEKFSGGEKKKFKKIFFRWPTTWILQPHKVAKGSTTFENLDFEHKCVQPYKISISHSNFKG